MSALDCFFRPRGVAFVGATEDATKLGGRRYRSLVEEGFAGPVYPVHPRAESLRGRRAYRSVAELPDPVDLAVIVVPTEHAARVVAECAARRIPGVMMITAGFGEVDEAGRAAERAFAATLAAADGRMLGPNCAGLFCAASNLNIGGAQVPRGGVALVSHSGNLLLDLNQHARERGGGFSRQVTIGNAVDLGSTELIADCLDDPETRVVLAYLEGWREGEGRALVELARRNGGRKPIIVLKPGRSEAGQQAALSHTGALAGEERVVDAALRGAGILRPESVEGAWDLAVALCSEKRVADDRVIVVSDGGGHATVLCDTLGLSGLRVAPLDAGTRAALARDLPPRAAVANPVDFAGVVESDPAALPRALKVCLSAPDAGAVAVAGHFGGYHLLGGKPLEEKEVAAAQEVAALAAASPRPLVVHSIHGATRPAALALLHEAGIPVLRSPEAAARLLAGLHRAGRTPPAPMPAAALPEEADIGAVRALIAAARAGQPAGRLALLEPEARGLTGACGLAVPPFRLAASEAECAAAVAALAPVPAALKLIAPGLVHRSEAGGVLLGVAGEAAARDGFARLVGVPPEASRAAARVMVTAMIPPGLEVICGAFRDAQFGPVVLFGLGGVAVEALGDVALALAPLDRAEARALLKTIRARALLSGYRGRPAVDREAASDLLVRLGVIMAAVPEIAEIDLNPVMLAPDGALIADVRVVLG